MDKINENNDFVIYVAVSADLADLAGFLGKVFSKHEPPAVAAGFPAHKIEALAKVFGAKSISEKLSVVARSKDTGKLIGVVLAHDFGTPPSDEIQPLIPTFEPLLAFLEQLEDQYLAAQSITAGDFMHVFMIAVDEGWSGKGIAQQLLRACISNSASLGYGTIFTEATSDVSRRVFRNLGFQEQYFSRYEDFEFQGSHPFASIREHNGCALMDMKVS